MPTEGRKPLRAMSELTTKAGHTSAPELSAVRSRLSRPLVFDLPERLSEYTAWAEHTPFAMWAVEMIRPRVLVELGTHAGVSYCAFTQAVKTLGLDTACYAVDTWEGDAHTSKYDESIFEELRRHHDPRYSSFSTLVRATFETAAASFAEGSIDLLHIDGYHTYEAVSGDFATWRPKLSDRAVVLFHDINERRDDFGAWKFWEEVRRQHPSFHFLHGHGLGVLALGAAAPEPIRWLTGLDSAEAAEVRDFFATRGRIVLGHVELLKLQREAGMDARHIKGLEEAVAILRRDVAGHEEHMRSAAEKSRLELEAALTRLHEANLRTQAANEEASRRQGIIDEAQRHLAETERDLASQNVRVGQLEQTVAQTNAQLRSLGDRIRGFESSTSWRITAPVRLVGRMVGLTRQLLRSVRHRIDLKLCTPVIISDAPFGHADWYQVDSSRGRLPTGWSTITYAGPSYDGTVFLTLFIDHGDGHWHTVALPSIRGGPTAHKLRLPDAIVRMRLRVQGSRGALPEAPKLEIREIGGAELALRLAWRERSRLPNALLYLMRNGFSATIARAMEVHGERGADIYHRWITSYDTLNDGDRRAIAAHVRAMRDPPLISVVVPVYNPAEAHLRAMLDSVLAQLYPNWELCVADDASTAAHVRPVLEEYARRDTRVKVEFRETNGHISAASNSALALATGGYVALLDHDDTLAEHALYIVAVAIADNPDADLLYSDEDKINDAGLRTEPYFKPDFGIDLLLGQNFISHLGVYRTEAIRAAGGFRLGYEGSQDYDLALRVIARTKGPVVHMPWVLYHWRLFPGAGTFSSTQISKASKAARKAIADYLQGQGVEAAVEPWVHAYHRVVRADLPAWPKVSAIVPTRDHLSILRVCVEGLLERTDYPSIELVIANNDSVEPETLAYLDRLRADPRVKILDVPGPFNFSAINNQAVRASSGEIVLLLNNDIEVIESGWLKELVKHAARPEVGAVGAKLLYPDGTLQHGGVVLGLNGVAGHLHSGVPASSPGYFGWLRIAHNVSAVTAACLALRRSVFDEVGGLDEVDLKVAFNDVDLCLKISEKGYAVVWTPEAVLTHWESKSRGSDLTPQHLGRFKSEIAYMHERWGERLERDHFFNPNLSLSTAHPVAAFPPRVERPWRMFLKPPTTAA